MAVVAKNAKAVSCSDSATVALWAFFSLCMLHLDILPPGYMLHLHDCIMHHIALHCIAFLHESFHTMTMTIAALEK